MYVGTYHIHVRKLDLVHLKSAPQSSDSSQHFIATLVKESLSVIQPIGYSCGLLLGNVFFIAEAVR